MSKSIYDQEFLKGIARRVSSCAKLNLEEKDALVTINSLFDYINYFNSLGEFDTRCLGRSLDEIEIIDELAEFIYPKSIRCLGTDLTTSQLLDAEPYDGNVTLLNYNEFINLQITFRGYFKKDFKDNKSSLMVLRKDLSLLDNLDRIYIKGLSGNNVRSLGAPFIPYPVKKFVGGLFEKSYFNMDVPSLLNEYMTRKIFDWK